jgi:signal transduction histidine kinase
MSPALAQRLFAAINEHEAALARVARLLHDDVSQILSAVGLQLDAMRMDFRDQAPGIETRAGEIQTMLEQVIQQLRDLSNELNPSIVERAGLQFALEQLASKAREGFAGVIRLQQDPGTHVPPVIAKTFYKIGENALSHALTRPGCSQIEIQMKRSHGDFVLEISDNGEPDDANSNSPPLERLLMDYYAAKDQVALKVTGSPSEGTRVRASYPTATPDSQIAS